MANAIEFPAHGQARTSNELRKQGVFVSASGGRSIWLRHDLENFKKRLNALEKKSLMMELSLLTRKLQRLMRFVVKLIQPIQAILARKIHSTLVI